MVRDNKTALCTPIIGRVIELNRYVLLKRQLVSKTIRHTHFVTLLTSCNLLFQMAMRQVRGKDYYKRAKELNIKHKRRYAEKYLIVASGSMCISRITETGLYVK